jgi:hypothetical protein
MHHRTQRLGVPVAMFLAVSACRSAGQTPALADAGAAPLQAAAAQSTITTDMIDRYVGFEKERRDAEAQWFRQSGGHIGALGADMAFGQTLKALREKHGLNEQDVTAVAGLFNEIEGDREGWKRIGGDEGLARMEKTASQMPKVNVAANAPPQMRELQKNLEAAEQGLQKQQAQNIEQLKRQRDLADVREKYGNALVEYALKNGGIALEPDNTALEWVNAKNEAAKAKTTR